MIVNNISQESSILNTFIAEIRDKNVQQDRMRFRRNIERIGEVLAYEMSKSFTNNIKNIQTPLGVKAMDIVQDDIVVCSILRAGIPLHSGFLNYFDNAENAFISAYRKHTSENDFEIVVEYLASPSIAGKTLLLVDPMLATGQSMVAVYKSLLKLGTPKNIHIAAVIGAQQGVDFVAENFPKETTLWIATVDEKLNEKGYIVPGLGDAGDLSFGTKLQ
jgi:uracil phosphoribosyltransferase